MSSDLNVLHRYDSQSTIVKDLQRELEGDINNYKISAKYDDYVEGRKHLESALEKSLELQKIVRSNSDTRKVENYILAIKKKISEIDEIISDKGLEDDELSSTEESYREGVEYFKKRFKHSDSLEEFPSFDDIVGMNSIKETMRRAIIVPMRFPHLVDRDIDGAPNLLLFGAPGNGKTAFAQAAAKELGVNFIYVRPSEIMNQYYGESEKRLDALFDAAREVREETGKDVIIFIDEVESLARSRNAGGHEVSDKLVNSLLQQLEGFNKLHGVSLIAATNHPDQLDQAFLDRMNYIKYVPYLNKRERKSYISRLLKKKYRKSHGGLADDVDFDRLAELSENVSNRNIQNAIVRLLQEERGKSFDMLLKDLKSNPNPESLPLEKLSMESLEEVFSKLPHGDQKDINKYEVLALTMQK